LDAKTAQENEKLREENRIQTEGKLWLEQETQRLEAEQKVLLEQKNSVIE
jgi:hypothetical protein